MSKIKTIYHGSYKIIDKPKFGIGSSDMDYGSGFYTTMDKEWGITWSQMYGKDNENYCNEYQLDITDLKILNLDQYGPIVWIAELLSNRNFSLDYKDKIQDIVTFYKLDTSKADVIIGYRANGAYCTILESFLKGHINLNETISLMKKGDLGTQWFIKSEKAFDRINYIGYDKIIEEHPYLKQDFILIKEIKEFLIKREQEIERGIYQPIGILVDDLSQDYYKYDIENQYFYIADYEEIGEPNYDYDDK